MPGVRNPLIYSAFMAGAVAFVDPAPAQSARDLCAKESGDKAIAACDKAIADNPKDADFYNNRGFTWSARGDQDKAIADFNEALKIKSETCPGPEQPRRRMEPEGRSRPGDCRRHRSDQGQQAPCESLQSREIADPQARIGHCRRPERFISSTPRMRARFSTGATRWS